jgi:hypothetical protein
VRLRILVVEDETAISEPFAVGLQRRVSTPRQSRPSHPHERPIGAILPI